jgi:hypothetical protein
MTDNTVSADLRNPILHAESLDDAARKLEAEEAAAEKAAKAPPAAKKVEEPPEEPEEPAEEEKPDDAAEAERKRQRPGKTQRHLARLEEENRTLKEAIARSQPAKPPEAPQTAQEPRPENFKTQEEYASALIDYRVDKKIAEREQAAHQQRAREAQQVAEATFVERTAKAREKYEDFDDIAFDPAVPITDAAADIIKNSDVGPELAYHLGSNLAEARRIAGLHPLLQAKELGKIEAMLTATAETPKAETPPPPPAKPKPKLVSSAPAPVKEVVGAETPMVDPDKLGDDAWLAWRNKTKQVM